MRFFVLGILMLGSWMARAAIPLTGVTGEHLRSRAFFDANNVTVGDPLVLTIDFIGSADFTALHPPALSRAVAADDWKVDDASAKTQTDTQQYRSGWQIQEVNVARRLTYRVRPMREGVLWFPALEFEFVTAKGEARRVTSNEIPVHARKGSDVVVAEMGKDENAMPEPAALIEDPGVALSEDELFQWRRAVRQPTADNFHPFAFPAGRLNEARCAILAGDWKRGLDIFSRLEWQTGQTVEIERGIVAALARRYENPVAELPVWRQVGRVVLRHDWKGRLGLVGGGAFALVLVFWLLGRLIRALACVAIMTVLAGTLSASAETIETVTTNADGSVTTSKTIRNGNFHFTSTQTTGGTGGMRMTSGGDPFAMLDDFDPFGRRSAAQPPVKMSFTLSSQKASVTVGEPFTLILAVEHPKTVELSGAPNVNIEEMPCLQVIGTTGALATERAANPTNVIRRYAFTLRAMRPLEGGLHYTASVDYLPQRRSFFMSPRPCASPRRTMPFRVRELPQEGRSKDFSGILADSISLTEACDTLQVGTNDVITVTYRLTMQGFLPEEWSLAGAAFEWGRQQSRTGTITAQWQRYVVADGSADATPKVNVVYYDLKTKKYKTLTAGGSRIRWEKR